VILRDRLFQFALIPPALKIGHQFYQKFHRTFGTSRWLRIERYTNFARIGNGPAMPAFGPGCSERRAYFTAMRYEMEHGGYEALLDFLLSRELSGFDAEDIPETPARLEHKLNAAEIGDKLLIGFANDGRLPGSSEDDGRARGLRARRRHRLGMRTSRTAAIPFDELGTYLPVEIRCRHPVAPGIAVLHGTRQPNVHA